MEKSTCQLESDIKDGIVMLHDMDLDFRQL
jgi:hypothetical protein